MESKKEKRSISYKTSNRVYLWAVLLMLVASIPAMILINLLPESSSSFVSLLAEDIYILSPLVAILACREKPNEILGFHKFRFSSAAWILLLVVLIYPITCLLNMIMLPFGQDTGSKIANSTAAIQLLITGCLLSPFCEEFLFRGVMFSGYKKSCGFLTALILTSVCFGLMHASISQLLYTMVAGFFFVLVIQATGSLWASLLAHVLNNTLAFFFWPKLFDYFIPGSALGSNPGSPTVGIVIALLIASLILTPIAFLVISKIAKGEDRENPLDLLRGSHRRQGEKNHFVTPALIIAWVILALVMITPLLRQ